MRLLHPDMLWWLWSLPVLAAFYLWAWYRRRHLLHRFAQQHLIIRLNDQLSTPRRTVRTLLCLLAVASLIFALTQPGWNPHLQKVPRLGRDIVILLDVSRSMLAEDIKPNRLERAKLALTDMLSVLRGDRVALITFAGATAKKSPLTFDYGFLRSVIQDIDTTSVQAGGTMMGDAIRTALHDVFDEKQTDYKDILLITDGEDHGSFPVQAAAQAGAQNIRLFAVGLGDPRQGALIPNPVDDPQQPYLTDQQGDIVRTRLDEQTLIQMVNATPGGKYLPVGTSNFNLAEFYRSAIAPAAGRELESGSVVTYEEKFQIFIVLVLLLLAVESILGETLPAAASRRNRTTHA